MTGEELPPFHFASLGLLLPLASALLAGVVPSQGCEVAPGRRSGCGGVAPLRTMWVNLGSYVLPKKSKKYAFFSFLCYERIQICIRSIQQCHQYASNFFFFFQVC